MKNDQKNKEEVKVTIIHEKPPVYDLLQARFGIDWNSGIIITYYPNVHCIAPLPPEKIIHEAVHIRQQKAIGVENWWHKFMVDSIFRLEQEIEAHREEARFIKKYIKDRNHANEFIIEIAKNLSGPIYGNIVTFQEAMKMIK